MEKLIEKALPYLAAIIASLTALWQWNHTSARQEAEYYRKKLHEQEQENDQLKSDLLRRDTRIARLENRLQEVQDNETKH